MTTFIFNQYYIDFLKRIKEVAKTKKDTCEDSKKYLKKIKEHYATLDKSSDEYLLFLNSNISDDVWDAYLSQENANEWMETNKTVMIFKDISLETIVKILDDNYLKNSFEEIKSASKRGEVSTRIKYDEDLEDVLNKLSEKYPKNKIKYRETIEEILNSFEEDVNE